MRNALTILLIVLSVNIFAQNGMIQGVVRDNVEDTTLYRAKVFIKGSSMGSYSDMRGKYSIKNVPPGEYTITVIHMAKGYNSSVSGVVVGAGETVIKDINLGQAAVKLATKTLDLSDFVDKASEEALLDETKDESKTVSIIGTEETSKQGIKNVGGAVKRVSGVSLEGGKYANIRGLNGRYNKTLLNGSEIPGLDPNRNAVQLDLFPTAFLSSIKVIKTFAPDLPGDFTGGLIDIRIKEAPDSLEVKTGLGLSYNPNVHFQDGFLGYKGSSTDFLGFDNGNRSLPNEIQDKLSGDGLPTKVDNLLSQTSFNESTELTKTLNPLMAPSTNAEKGGLGAAPINHSMYFTIGNTIQNKDSLSISKIGYFVGFNYRRGYSFYENGDVSRYVLPGSIETSTGLLAERTFKRSQSKDNVLMGGLASLSFKKNANNSIHLNFIHNHSGTKRSSKSVGFDMNQPDSEFRVYELDYIERSINSLQLVGKHKFDSIGMKSRPSELNWLASGTYSSQDQPDYRIFSDDIATLSDGSEIPLISPAIYQLPTRFFRNMYEVNSDAKVDYTITYKDTDTSHFKVKMGLSNTFKFREFSETRLEYDLNNLVYNGNPNDAIATENIGSLSNGSKGVLIYDASQEQNNYRGTRMISGAYGMADFSVGKFIDMVSGVRFENTIINVSSAKASLPKGEILVNDVLPSVGMTFNLINGKAYKSRRDSNEINKVDMKIRTSYNRTVARPNFREIAPYASEDFIRKTTLLGNIDLMPSDINNFDVRWELYPRTNEVISISGFYKEFINPIGLFANPSAGNAEFQWKNLEYSTVFGGEAELKKRLDFIAKPLKNFTVAFNYTLVKSVSPIPEAELAKIRATDNYRPDTRPLTGQSPYLFNSTLEYNNDSLGMNVNLTFNQFGDRLVIYSSDGRPDVYEKSRPMLNLNFSKQINDRFKIKASLTNLLDPSFIQAYEYKNATNSVYEKMENQEANFSSYKKGRSIGFGMSYKF